MLFASKYQNRSERVLQIFLSFKISPQMFCLDLLSFDCHNQPVFSPVIVWAKGKFWNTPCSSERPYPWEVSVYAEMNSHWTTVELLVVRWKSSISWELVKLLLSPERVISLASGRKDIRLSTVRAVRYQALTVASGPFSPPCRVPPRAAAVLSCSPTSLKDSPGHVQYVFFSLLESSRCFWILSSLLFTMKTFP